MNSKLLSYSFLLGMSINAYAQLVVPSTTNAANQSQADNQASVTGVRVPGQMSGFVMPYGMMGQPNSIEASLANLNQMKQMLQQQLTVIDSRITVLQRFLDAQRGLNLQWSEVTNRQPPANAMEVDIGAKSPVKLCQARFQRGIHPGVVTDTGCMITYGGDSLILQDYSVLTGKANVVWQADPAQYNHSGLDASFQAINWQSNNIPVAGGFERGHPLFICKANYNNINYVGKLVNTNCNIAVGAREIKVPEYQVLFGNKK